MEVTRQRLGNGAGGDFRSRQLNAKKMLQGELEGPELEQHALVALIVRRETGVMAASALVVALLAGRAQGWVL